MKKIIFFPCLFLLFWSNALAQERLETPTWNRGDKWVFTQGSIEVVGVDDNGYTLSFSRDTCVLENKGFQTIIYDKSTLNRIYSVKNDLREEYKLGLKRLLNFPIDTRKEWKSGFTAAASVGMAAGETSNYAEGFRVVGRENLRVQAGSFDTIKLEYLQINWNRRNFGRAFYWYAPDVRYFVKCEYDSNYYGGVPGWELVSFQLKK